MQANTAQRIPRAFRNRFSLSSVHLALEPFPIGLAQLVLQQLAARVPRQRGEEIDGLAKVVVPLLTGLPAVFSEGFPGAFFAKNSAHKIAFLTGSGPKREVIVNKGLNPV